MAKGTALLWFFAVAVVGQALTPSSFFTTIDQERLKDVFEVAQPYSDVTSAHYSILGFKILGISVPKAQDACTKITSSVDKNDVASIYHASTASKALDKCKLTVPNGQETLSAAIKEDSTVTNIYHAFFALKNLGLKVDDAAVKKALLGALKKDDSPLSQGYSFYVAAELSGDINKFFDNIEDVVAQADEVDDKYLQFEGGLYTTSVVIDAAYKLAEKAKKAPTISQDKVIKFANYFLSRKHVHQLKSTYQLLSVIKTLTTNKFHIPIAVSLASSVAVSQDAPQVKVRVTDLMGGDLGQLTVTADSARHIGDEAIVINKKPFTASKTDKTLHELDFMQVKPARGFYKITISVAPKKADSRLIGTTGAVVQVKVTTQVSIENVEIGVADKDQTTAARTTKLQHPKKAANVLEVDYQQKIIMKFQLKDKNTGKLLIAHQAFMRFVNQKTNQEIIFVTEADSSQTNKFDLDVGNAAKEFTYLSGKYTMELIVGDAVIENPFSWALADVKLTFPEGMAKEGESISQYSKKPEIKHMFRDKEKQPPAVISTTFTALCLLPLVILFALWLKLGANISNFPLSLSAVGFHVSLAGVFALYFLYFHSFTMFESLRYLAVIGIPLFLFGNRLLSSIAAKRKS